MKIKDFRNDLLKRREVNFVVKSSSNPGFDQASKLLTEHEKVNEENIVIKKVEGGFGSGDFNVEAFIYDSVDDKNKVEQKKKEKKK